MTDRTNIDQTEYGLGQHNNRNSLTASSGGTFSDRINREWLGLRDLTYYAHVSELGIIRSCIFALPSIPFRQSKVCGKVLAAGLTSMLSCNGIESDPWKRSISTQLCKMF